ncbi:MAG: hypothetical protein EON52_24880 [Actinomycetales bacterium]|nr:MAG: hypothetical protein EON52_24880 [Actinomycetales bacterium]
MDGPGAGRDRRAAVVGSRRPRSRGDRGVPRGSRGPGAGARAGLGRRGPAPRARARVARSTRPTCAVPVGNLRVT